MLYSYARTAPVIYQAEDGVLSGTLVGNTSAGYQGSGYVYDYTAPGDACSVTVNAPASGFYNITMGYRSEFGLKYNDLYVNNAFYSSVTFTMTSSFAVLDAGMVFLNAGNNELEVVYNWGYIELDWIGIEIVPASAQQISNYDLMPASVSTGQQDVYAVMFTIKNPSGGVAQIKGITFTVKDSQSNLLSASSALAAFGISDGSYFFYRTDSVAGSSYIYCDMPAGIEIGAYSERNFYAVMDITGNTLSRAAEFKIDIDSNSAVRAEDLSSGNTLMVMAASGFYFPEGSSAAYIQNRATELSLSHKGTMPASVSTDQSGVKAMELFFTDVGNTVTAGIKVSRISFLIHDSAGNSISAQSAIKNLKITNNNGTFIYGEADAGLSNRITVVLSAPLIVPSTQDFTCAVAIDTASSVTAGSFVVSLGNPGDIFAVDANSSNPVVVTSLSSFPKASGAAVIQVKADTVNADSYTALLPGGVFKGQKWLEIFSFQLQYPFSAQSAPALFNGITISVKNGAGSPAPANGAIEKFYITDSLGVTLGSVSTGVLTGTYLALTEPLTFASGVSTVFRVFADVLASAYSPDFMVTVDESSDISVTDSNSGYQANIEAAPLMPWNTGFAGIFDAPATDLLVWHNGNVAPTMAGMAQPDVKFMSLYMSNPGYIGTAAIEVRGLTLTVVDEDDNTVPPSYLLSKVYVTNIPGDFVFAEHDALQHTAAASFYVPFSTPVYADALNTKSAYVSGDIAMHAQLGTYRLRIGTQDNINRQSVPLGHVTITAVNTSGFPLDSNPVTITALAYNFKVGHRNLMPVSVSKGSTGVEALSINFQNYNSLPIAVTSLAVSVKKCTGELIRADRVISSIKAYDRDNSFITAADAGISGRVVMAPLNFIIPSGAEREIKLAVDVLPTADGPFYVELESETDILTLPLASVNPAERDFFGNMKSGCVSLQERNLSDSFHVFPNPFNPLLSAARIQYYLETESDVTIRIYTMNGNLVKTLADKSHHAAGLHYGIKWDGMNSAGRAVNPGVYLCVLEAVDKAAGKSVTLKKKLAVQR